MMKLLRRSLLFALRVVPAAPSLGDELERMGR